jgi:hypothetical protein
VIKPSYKILLEENVLLWQSRAVHENFRLYKYRWRVFTLDSPYEGDEFFRNTEELSTANAMSLVKSLLSSGRPGIVYNRRMPRKSSPMIFNPNAQCWVGVKWAVDYDLDPDVAWEGHK